mgnify:CR=1 FL=1
MENLFANKPFVAAFVAVVTAQLLKTIFNLIIDGEFNLKRAASTGGMPSSHAATVVALSTSIGMLHGIESPLFAIAIVFSIIVIYDAVGIRQAAGKHAKMLNEWSKILSEIYENGIQPANLKTLLGHNYPQVLAGSGLGLLIGYLVTIYL